MTDLVDWAEPLRRAVARPGEFAVFFPTTTDTNLIGVLLDAFGEAQLDGFLVTPTLFSATDLGIVTPDLTRAQAGLLLIYGSVRFLRAELANRKNRTHYAARGNTAETEQSSNIITTLLKEGEARLTQLRERQRLVGNAGAFMMADAYLIKAIGYPSNAAIALAGEAYAAMWEPGPYFEPTM